MTMDYQKTLLQRNLKLFVGLSIFFELSVWQGEYCVVGQSATCTKYERYLKSHYVSYVETYRARKWGVFWKTATRHNYRWDFLPDVRIVEECCHGYTRGGTSSECVPVCPSGCDHGVCQLPNLCKCHPGFNATLSPVHGWMECVPYCPNGCIDGECTGPGICTCNSGYLSIGGDSNVCLVSCRSVGAGGLQGCGDSAFCIAPGQCQCHAGYQRNQESSQPFCAPICTPACGTNAYCASPDNCLCEPGHVIDVNPLFALGASPNYQKFTTVGTEPKSPSTHCKPLCEPECAKNSTCIAPNVCQCDAGYRSESSLNETDHPLRCDPICEKTCVNSLCAYPNKCMCHLGYRPHPIDNFTCEPICEDGCIHALCVQPDHCECHGGYVKKDNNDGNHEINSTNVCVPSCPGGCPHGTCIAPGQCACDPGYVLGSQETTLDFSTGIDLSSSTKDITGYYSDDSGNYYSTDSTEHYDTKRMEHYSSTERINYYGTDSAFDDTDDSIDSSSTTVAPTSQQFCQPLCEPECASGSICIAPPDRCQHQTGIDEDSDDSVGDRTVIKNVTTICNRNGTENGTACNPVESAIIGHEAASAIGALLVLAAILGLGAFMYSKLRGRRQPDAQAIVTNFTETMERLSVADPLISTDESSYL